MGNMSWTQITFLGARIVDAGKDHHSLRPGDWMCTNCAVNVYASRAQCFRCQAPRRGRRCHPALPRSSFYGEPRRTAADERE